MFTAPYTYIYPAPNPLPPHRPSAFDTKYRQNVILWAQQIISSKINESVLFKIK